MCNPKTGLLISSSAKLLPGSQVRGKLRFLLGGGGYGQRVVTPGEKELLETRKTPAQLRRWNRQASAPWPVPTASPIVQLHP